MKKWFSQFRELILSVAPYQMPSFAIRSILQTYLLHFRADTLQELVYRYLMEVLLMFPISNYDRKFVPDKAYTLAAGVYFAGIKQDQPGDTIIPEPIMKVYQSSPELQNRFPDPFNLIRPDNLLLWAKTEGLSNPEISSYIQSITPFSKYPTPQSSTTRKIVPDTKILDPYQPNIIEVPKEQGGVRKKVFGFLFEKAKNKTRQMGIFGLVQHLKKMQRS